MRWVLFGCTEQPKWPRKFLSYGLCLLLGCAGLAASAAPLSETLAEQVRKGEVVWLEVAGVRVLAIHGAAEKTPLLGAAILLHDEGAHADWPQLIRPLRSRLPAYGWHTLALELPPYVTPSATQDSTTKTASDNAAFAHIDAGLAWLKKKGVENTALIGHGRGAALAVGYLLAKPQAGFVGLVLLSPLFRDEPAAQRRKLAEIRVPVLEIIAGRDYVPVRRFAETPRLPAEGKTENPYRQLEIEGAEHDYRSHEAVLLKRLRGWLKHLVAGKAVNSGG